MDSICDCLSAAGSLAYLCPAMELRVSGCFESTGLDSCPTHLQKQSCHKVDWFYARSRFPPPLLDESLYFLPILLLNFMWLYLSDFHIIISLWYNYLT